MTIPWFELQSRRGVAYGVAKIVPSGSVESLLAYPAQVQLLKFAEIFLLKGAGGRALCQLWDNETNNRTSEDCGSQDHESPDWWVCLCTTDY